jgi:hypothetical protein
LFPPQYNKLIGVGGEQGYPPLENNPGYPPPKYEPVVPYSHDFRGLEGARCPQLVFRSAEGIVQAEVLQLTAHVECNYSAAFVTMSGVFRTPSGKVSDDMLKSATFQLPLKHNSAVTNCQFRVGSPSAKDHAKEWKWFDVTCLANSDAQELANKAKEKGAETGPGPIPDEDPSAFTIPVAEVKEGYDVIIQLTYYEHVECFGPNYELLVPLGFSAKHMPLDQMQQRCAVTFAINAGIRNFESQGYQFPGTMGYQLSGWSTTHQVWANQDNPTRMSGQVVNTVAWPTVEGHGTTQARDLVLCYTTVSDSIMGHVVVERPPPNSYDERDSYALFLTPPTNPASMVPTYRRIIFVLDKSYSMTGEPFERAKAALKSAIQMLRPQDMFAIHMFSDKHDQWPVAGPDNGDTGFYSATPQNIEAAHAWISPLQTDGLTDILGAVQQCEQKFAKTREASAAHGLVDFCFLLTDGAVSNERDVCKFIKADMPSVRFLTFGVGGYVNTAFLRMIGRTGRGFTDISLNPACLYDQMTHLLSKANFPLMTDITVQFEGEMYPEEVPDLYCGSSVVVGGKRKGPLPGGTVVVSGKVGGQPYSLTITPESNPYVPVHQLFVKTMLDDLTAQAWLTEDPKIQERVTNISVNENMTSVYTTQVAHPVDPPKPAGKDQGKGKGKDDGKKKEPKRGEKGFNAKHAAAAVAVGAVAGVGIYVLAKNGAFSGFGNIAATAANNPVTDAMGSALSGAGDLLGAAFDGVVNIGSSAAGAVADVAVEGADAVGGCCSTICGDVCGPVADICQPCTNVCDTIGDFIKDCNCNDMVNTCGDTCTQGVNTCGDTCSGFAGNCGDACSGLANDCGNVAGEVLNNVGPCLETLCDVIGQILGAFLGG